MTYVFWAAAVAILLVLLVLARRTRVRVSDADARLRRDITVGSQVMTTSGLYATVSAINSDDTVILSIAPGIEVRWAFAALRGAATLPPRYRRAMPLENGTGTNRSDGVSRSADIATD